MCIPKAILQHSIWPRPAPCILRKRRLDAENLGFREHTGLGKALATHLYGLIVWSSDTLSLVSPGSSS